MQSLDKSLVEKLNGGQSNIEAAGRKHVSVNLLSNISVLSESPFSIKPMGKEHSLSRILLSMAVGTMP